MTKPNVQIHICDAQFKIRCPFQEAFVVPAAATPDDAAAPDELRAAIVSSHASSCATDCERVPLGWKCPLCGTVEVEKVFWRTYFKTDEHLEKLEAAATAAAKGSRSNRRRIQKEKLREKRLAVRPFCDNCYVCPRCESGSGGVLGGLQLHVGTAVSTEGGELQFHVSCPCCRWQTYRSFPSMETLLGCLSAMDAFASREDTLRPWRRAQRETNDLLRALYAQSAHLPQERLNEKSTTFSRLSWSKYTEILRPSQRMPNQHGQARGKPNTTASRDVSFGQPTVAGTKAAGSVTAGATTALAAVPGLPEVPRLNLNFDRGGVSTNATVEDESKLSPMQTREEQIVDEIREKGTMYTSNGGLHAAEALDKLRSLFEMEQQYDGKQILSGKNNEMKKLPSFVRCIKEPEMRALRQQEEEEEEDGAHHRRRRHGESPHWHRRGEKIPGQGVAENREEDSKLAPLECENTLLGNQQAAQLGLHPLFTGSAPSVEDLQEAMLPFNAHVNSGMSRLTAPTRTGLKKQTPLQRRGAAVSADISGISPIPFASPRPVTARNVAASGPEAALLENLLSSPAHAQFITSLFSYYIQHPHKTPITAVVRPLPAASGCEGGSIRNRFAVLDVSAVYDADVQQIVSYWSRSADDADAAQRGGTGDEDTVDNWRDDGLPFRPIFLPESSSVATRSLPFIQFTQGAEETNETESTRRLALSFRMSNLGTQTMLLRDIKIVKRNVKGGECSLHRAGSDRSSKGALPTSDSPTSWVRLAPQMSAKEAAVAGQVDRAAAVLPPSAASASAATPLVKELNFDVLVCPRANSSPPSSGYVGLELDVLTFLTPHTGDGANSTSPSQSTGRIHGDYYRVCFGTSIVW